MVARVLPLLNFVTVPMIAGTTFAASTVATATNAIGEAANNVPSAGPKAERSGVTDAVAAAPLAAAAKAPGKPNAIEAIPAPSKIEPNLTLPTLPFKTWNAVPQAELPQTLACSMSLVERSRFS